MSSPYTQAQLKTPKGFEHLLEGLCKEVLRRQPENILEYATEHFSRLMKLREETGYDGYTPKAEIGLEPQEEIAGEEMPVLLEPEESAAEDQPGGETQDDAPEAEQTGQEIAAPEEARTADETTADDKAAGETTADDKAADETTADDKAADETTADDKAADETTADDKAADETTADDKDAENITADDKAADETTADDKAADETTAGDKDAENITAEDKAYEDIAYEDITAEDVTAEDVTAEDVTAETITADETPADAGTESERPESEKAESIGLLPESGDIASSAEEGERAPGEVTRDTEPSTKAKGAAENETIKEQSPRDSGEVTVDPASTELPDSDGDSS